MEAMIYNTTLFSRYIYIYSYIDNNNNNNNDDDDDNKQAMYMGCVDIVRNMAYNVKSTPDSIVLQSLACNDRRKT